METAGKETGAWKGEKVRVDVESFQEPENL